MSTSHPLNHEAPYPGGHPDHGYPPPPGNYGSPQVSTATSLTINSITLKDHLHLNTMDSITRMTIKLTIMREDSMTSRMEERDIIKTRRSG